MLTFFPYVYGSVRTAGGGIISGGIISESGNQIVTEVTNNPIVTE